MKRGLIGLIRLYQILVRPLVAQGVFPLSLTGCRSWPTCSDYSIMTIEQYGIIRGGYRSIVRFLRCNPFSHLQ